MLLKISKEGEILGHRSLFSQAPYPFTATAMSEVRACVFKKESFQSLLKDSEKASQKLILQMITESNEMDSKYMHLRSMSLRSRLAQTLLELAQSVGETKGTQLHSEAAQSVQIQVQLSRSELAAMIGGAPENVMRLIVEFKNLDLIAEDKKKLTIKNKKELQRIASSF